MANDVKDFSKEVLEESYNQPVLVDFWAPWCGPCRVLGPVIEKLASEANGQWKLVKVNVDENQEIAARYQVRGIPAVKLFNNGKIDAEFTGALPEIQIRRWLEQNIPSKQDILLQEAIAILEKSDTRGLEMLHQLEKQDPENPALNFYLGKAYLFKDSEKSFQYFNKASASSDFVDQAIYYKKLSSLLEMKENPAALPEDPVKEEFLKALQATSDKDFETAISTFIDVLMKNKSYLQEAARVACIAIFFYLGEQDEIVKKFRRRFNMALY